MKRYLTIVLLIGWMSCAFAEDVIEQRLPSPEELEKVVENYNFDLIGDLYLDYREREPSCGCLDKRFKCHSDPEYMFKKFLKNASKRDFIGISCVSRAIFAKGSYELKKAYVLKLKEFEQDDITTLCAFELGKILLYGKLDGKERVEEGIKLIKRYVDIGYDPAFKSLIEYYASKNDEKKQFYYMEKMAEAGTVTEELIVFCINKGYFKKARLYIDQFINSYKDMIVGIREGKAVVTSISKSEAENSLKKLISRKAEKYNKMLSRKKAQLNLQ